MNNLTTTEVHNSKTVELISVKIDLPNKKTLIISSFYRPPKTDKYIYKTTSRKYQNKRQDMIKLFFVLVGTSTCPILTGKLD